MDEHGHRKRLTRLASLTPQKIRKYIQTLTDSKHLWVGYSGGVDSHVLLDLMVHAFAMEPDYQVGAVHVHHGLHNDADAWVKQCEQICASLQIPLKVLWVDASVKEGGSPEEAAREARFQALEEFLSEEEALLLGHHESDQAETILFRLFRGAGPKGLGGMETKVNFGKSHLIRPLLSVPKEDILSYAKQRNLKWIEDDSNQNCRFDRNFLRNEIIPQLTARWPRVLRSINRTGVLCLETATAVQALALQDLPAVKGKVEGTLSVSQLLKLESTRRRGVIRLWLQLQGFSFPSQDHMERIEREVLKAKSGAKPRLKISHYEIKRKKDELMVNLFT